MIVIIIIIIIIIILLLLLLLLKCTYLSVTVTLNAAGALYTVNKVPGYNI